MSVIAQNPVEPVPVGRVPVDSAIPQGEPAPRPVSLPTKMLTPIPRRYWAYPGISGTVILPHLVQVKMKSADVKPQLILMLDAYEIETRKVTKKAARIEQRTRTIIVDGIEREQTYSVAVPVTAVGAAEARKPVGLRPKTIEAQRFAFFDLFGKPVSIAEASKRLEKLTPVFLLDNFRGEVIALPEIQRQALSPKCLIVTSKFPIREPDPAANLPHY